MSYAEFIQTRKDAENNADNAENNIFPVDDERRFYQPRNEELTAHFDEQNDVMIEEYRSTNYER